MDKELKKAWELVEKERGKREIRDFWFITENLGWGAITFGIIAVIVLVLTGALTAGLVASNVNLTSVNNTILIAGKISQAQLVAAHLNLDHEIGAGLIGITATLAILAVIFDKITKYMQRYYSRKYYGREE